MTLNDIINVLTASETISVHNYDQKKDEVGEHQYFMGAAGQLYADEAKLRRIGNRQVKAITQGLVSIMIAI